jgi:hypothetical protein
LTPGSYEVQARLPGYRPLLRSFTVSGDGSAITLSLDAVPTALNISTNLASGSVLLDGREVGTLNLGSFEMGEVADGQHEIVIRAPEATARISFRSTAGQLPELLRPIEVQNLHSLAATTLARQAQFISDGRIKTILLSRNPIGEVGSGVLSTELPVGSLQQIALREGESSWEFAPVSTGDTPTLSIRLIAANRDAGTLVVAAGQADVQVFVNGRSYSRTAADGNRNLSLPPDTYLVRVEKEGYVTPPEQRIALRRDENLVVPFNLTPTPVESTPVAGPVAVDVPPPVRIDDTPTPVPGIPNAVDNAETEETRARREWETLSSTRNPAGLEDFIRRFPTSSLTDDAQRLLTEVVWERIPKDDLDQLNGYIQRYPNSARDQEARRLIQRLQQLLREEALIDQLFENVVSAFNSRNIDELRRLWPSGAAGISKLLADSDYRYEMRMELLEKPNINQDKATVSVRQAVVSTVVRGRTSNPNDRPQEALQTRNFSLERAGGQWRIVSP